MITHPFLLLLLLVFIVSSVLFLAKIEKTKKFFKYLPAPLWCYFLPTAISTAGWIPSDSVLYAEMSRVLLPPCLILLLLGTDIPSIIRLSRKALLAMFAGSFGILVGGSITFLILSRWQIAAGSPLMKENVNDLWKGWGCLSASWTGGSANMIAVKEILKTPESLFSNLIIVDTIVAYSWMALLVFLSKYQKEIDEKLKSDSPTTYSAVTESLAEASEDENNHLYKNDGSAGQLLNRGWKILLLLAAAFLVGQLCWIVSAPLPKAGMVLNRITWTVILCTTIPLILSMTPAKKLESFGSNSTGNFLLYILLTSIGARANLYSLIASPFLTLLGIFWVIIHGIVLVSFGKLFKIPLSLLATASQANVGGTVSAPLVASVYQKNLAPVGIVLAVLGNIYGTAFGLFFSAICRRLADLL